MIYIKVLLSVCFAICVMAITAGVVITAVYTIIEMLKGIAEDAEEIGK